MNEQCIFETQSVGGQMMRVFKTEDGTIIITTHAPDLSLRTTRLTREESQRLLVVMDFEFQRIYPKQNAQF